MKTLQSAWAFLKAVFAAWQQDNVAQLGAALAYYTVISLAPLLIVVVVIAGLVFGQSQVRGEIMTQVTQIVGSDATQLIDSLIGSVSTASSNLLASAIAVGAILLGATGVFSQLQTSLNHIWGVQLKPGQGIRITIQKRLMSFLVILVVGLLLLVFLVINTLLPVLANAFSEAVPVLSSIALLQTSNTLLGFAIVTALFAIIYRLLPDVQIAWKDVLIGAAVTAALFLLGQWAITQYFASSSVASPYGAAGSLVALLIWVYYSAQIFFLGAEFTQVYADRYGQQIRPSANAVFVLRETRKPGEHPEDEFPSNSSA